MMRVKKSGKWILIQNYLKGNAKSIWVLVSVMSLIVILATVMLVLLYTNEHIKQLQTQMEYAPVDYSIGKLTMEQVEALRDDSSVSHVSVSQGEAKVYNKDEKSAFLIKGDPSLMTMTSKLIEGRYPEKTSEVVAEKWALMNLGIVPDIGCTIVMENPDTGKKESFYLTGILSDIYRNKKAGILEFYSEIQVPTSEQTYTAYVLFKDGVSCDDKMAQLQKDLSIADNQIVLSPLQNQKMDFIRLCGEVILLILIIGLVMFYGVYRITLISRVSHYGILRAVGFTQKSLKRMIVVEALVLYFCAVPIGLGVGTAIAHGILKLAGDYDVSIFMYNQCEPIELVMPWLSLGLFVLLMALGVGIIVERLSWQLVQKNIVDLINGCCTHSTHIHKRFLINQANGKISTIIRMSWKYILLDSKTSVFMVLVMCLSMVLFVGVIYEAKIAETFRADTQEMHYLNGDYAMSMLYYDNVDEGIQRAIGKNIESLPGVEGVKSCAGLPIRVIDQPNIDRNTAYYNKYNKRLENIHGFSDVGFDGIDQIYKSKLCGYNDNALKALEDYVIEGNFSAETLEENEVVLSIFSVAQGDSSNKPGSFKNGIPLMDYHVGDNITYKYRDDLKTDSLAYDRLEDKECSYSYKTVKVAAIVSFPYMLDNDRTVYPLFITKDDVIKKIAPDSAFQCVYVDTCQGMNLDEEKDLEKSLIRFGSNQSGVVTRSLMDEIAQNEKLYQKRMVYLYSIAFTCLLLMLINVATNLRYRMKMRSQEVGVLRAIGMSVKMLRKMLFFENLTLGIIASILAGVVSPIILKVLYHRSMMELFAHPYVFDIKLFVMIVVAIITICVVLSMCLLKEWKTKDVVSGFNKYE